VQSVGAELLAPGQETGAVRVAVAGLGAPWPDPFVAQRALLGRRGVRRVVLAQFQHVRLVRPPQPAGVHHATSPVRHIAASPTASSVRRRAALAVAQRGRHVVVRPSRVVQHTHVAGARARRLAPHAAGQRHVQAQERARQVEAAVVGLGREEVVAETGARRRLEAKLAGIRRRTEGRTAGFRRDQLPLETLQSGIPDAGRASAGIL